MRIIGLKLKPAVLLNLAASVLAGVFAQLLMKYGVNGLKGARGGAAAAAKTGLHAPGVSAGAEAGTVATGIIKAAKILYIIFSDKFVIAGIILYLVSMFFWIKVLSKIDLSVAYPFVSVGIVLTVLLASAALGESVPPMRWLGIFVTLCGVYITVSSHDETVNN